MKVGIVCPYALHVPGGVQAHVLDLATALRRHGHQVEVLAPAPEDTELPDYVTASGRAVSIPYNGSVARLSFGPVSFTRVRRWIANHEFDVLHLHEPIAPSLSMLALLVADGPIVATYHTSTPRSRTLLAFQAILQPFLEKITARIAVSALARRVQVEHLGSDAVEIPNGVDLDTFMRARPLPGYPRNGPTVGFLGRFAEPRKGMRVLLDALPEVLTQQPGLQLLVVGPGDPAELRAQAGSELAEHLRYLGPADDPTKIAALRSMDVYCAPNTGGESFGMILTEAMAAGAPVVASDLDAFRRVLGDGHAGRLSPVGDAAALAANLNELLGDDRLRAEYVLAARDWVSAYDWAVLVGQVVRVYETAIAATPGRVHLPGEVERQ
ncbi:MAG: glycosyltransferase family 4 protein [Sciscionella sp.]